MVSRKAGHRTKGGERLQFEPPPSCELIGLFCFCVLRYRQQCLRTAQQPHQAKTCACIVTQRAQKAGFSFGAVNPPPPIRPKRNAGGTVSTAVDTSSSLRFFAPLGGTGARGLAAAAAGGCGTLLVIGARALRSGATAADTGAAAARGIGGTITSAASAASDALALGALGLGLATFALARFTAGKCSSNSLSLSPPPAGGLYGTEMSTSGACAALGGGGAAASAGALSSAEAGGASGASAEATSETAAATGSAARSGAAAGFA